MAEIHVHTESGSLYVFNEDGSRLLRSSTVINPEAPSIEDGVPVDVLGMWPPLPGECVRFIYDTKLRTTSQVITVVPHR